MDAYATGGERRLLQRYNNESGLLTAGFVYDNALALIAYLARPSPANVRRASGSKAPRTSPPRSAPATGARDRERARGYLRQITTAQATLGAGPTVGRTSDPNDGRLFDPGEGGTRTGSPLPARSGIVGRRQRLRHRLRLQLLPQPALMAAQGVNPYRI
jgi:hypothetical protein